MSEKQEWYKKEIELSDSLMNDILFRKSDEDMGEIIQKAKCIISNHLQLLSYLMDNDHEKLLEDAKTRYEVIFNQQEECAAFSAKQAVEITKLEKKIIDLKSNLKRHGIIR